MDEECSTQQGMPQGASIAAGPQTSIDQSWKKFIGVKLIDAYPCSKDGQGEGYTVKYPDGYESWSPKKAFEDAYLQLDGDGTVITPAVIGSMIANVSVNKVDPKTALVKAELSTGFVMYEPSSCVCPENYNEDIGRKVGMVKINDRLWFAMGFILQWAKYGLNRVPKSDQGA